MTCVFHICNFIGICSETILDGLTSKLQLLIKKSFFPISLSFHSIHFLILICFFFQVTQHMLKSSTQSQVHNTIYKTVRIKHNARNISLNHTTQLKIHINKCIVTWNAKLELQNNFYNVSISLLLFFHTRLSNNSTSWICLDIFFFGNIENNYM